MCSGSSGWRARGGAPEIDLSLDCPRIIPVVRRGHAHRDAVFRGVGARGGTRAGGMARPRDTDMPFPGDSGQGLDGVLRMEAVTDPMPD